MAASGVTSTISPSPARVRPPYDPQASLDALRTWCGLLVEFQRQAESKGGCPLPPSPASSLRPTPTAAPTSPRASTSGKPRSALVYGPRTSAVGLIGSGMFVTDPVGGFPPRSPGGAGLDHAGSGAAPTRAGRLHNLFAIPVFAGIPVAAMASAATAVRGRDFRWAGYSAASGLAMVGSFVMFGTAFGDESRLSGKGGVFQRLSIACGCGWLTALSLRALSYPVH